MKGLGARIMVTVVVAVVALYLVLVYADAPRWLQRSPLHLAAITGSLAAGLAFRPGDRPRAPWLWLGGSPVLGLAAGVALHMQWQAAGVPLAPLAIVAANVVWAGAVFGLLRVVQSAGLAPAWSRASATVTVLAALLSVALMAPTVLDVVEAGAQSPTQWAWAARRLVGVLADGIVLSLCVQILRITYVMRGGAVAQPYFLLAASALVLLSVGLGLALTQKVLQLDLSVGLRIVDALGWSLLGLAGWSQRMLLVGLRGRLSSRGADSEDRRS